MQRNLRVFAALIATITIAACSTGNSSLTPAPQGLSKPSVRKNTTPYQQLVWVTSSNTGEALAFPTDTNTSTPVVDIVGSGLTSAKNVALSPQSGNIFVGNYSGLWGDPFIAVFKAGSDGASTAYRRITNVDPLGTAFDSAGNLWVSGLGTISMFPPGASTPSSTISGNATTILVATAIALGKGGDPFVASNTTYFNAGKILKFNGTKSGNVAPIQQLTGDQTGLVNPVGLALYYSAPSVGYIAVADATANQVMIWHANATGNVAPLAYIPSTATTKLQNPVGVAVDSSGNLYVSDAAQKAIFEYPASVFTNAGKNNVAPIHRINLSNAPAQISISTGSYYY